MRSMSNRMEEEKEAAQQDGPCCRSSLSSRWEVRGGAGGHGRGHCSGGSRLCGDDRADPHRDHGRHGSDPPRGEDREAAAFEEKYALKPKRFVYFGKKAEKSSFFEKYYLRRGGKYGKFSGQREI